MLSLSDLTAGKERLEARRARKAKRLEQEAKKREARALAHLELRLRMGQDDVSVEEWFASLDSLCSGQDGGCSFVNATDAFDGSTLLCVASQVKTVEYAQGLLDRKADVNLRFPLRDAVLCDNLHVAKLLLTQGAEPINAEYDESVLLVACRHAAVPIAALLLEGDMHIKYRLCERLWTSWRNVFQADRCELEGTLNQFFFLSDGDSLQRYATLVDWTYGFLDEEERCSHHELHVALCSWLRLALTSALLLQSQAHSSVDDAQGDYARSSSSRSSSDRGDYDGVAGGGNAWGGVFERWYRPLLLVASFLVSEAHATGFKAFVATRVVPHERMLWNRQQQRSRGGSRPRAVLLLADEESEADVVNAVESDNDDDWTAKWNASEEKEKKEEEKEEGKGDIVFVTPEAAELRNMLELLKPTDSKEAIEARMLASATEVWNQEEESVEETLSLGVSDPHERFA